MKHNAVFAEKWQMTKNTHRLVDKNKDGNILLECDKIIERLSGFVEELFDNSRADKPVAELLQGPDIVKSEIDDACPQMTKFQAVRMDSTVAFLALDDVDIDKLTELCNDD